MLVNQKLCFVGYPKRSVFYGKHVKMTKLTKILIYTYIIFFNGSQSTGPCHQIHLHYLYWRHQPGGRFQALRRHLRLFADCMVTKEEGVHSKSWDTKFPMQPLQPEPWPVPQEEPAANSPRSKTHFRLRSKMPLLVESRSFARPGRLVRRLTHQTNRSACRRFWVQEVKGNTMKYPLDIHEIPHAMHLPQVCTQRTMANYPSACGVCSIHWFKLYSWVMSGPWDKQVQFRHSLAARTRMTLGGKVVVRVRAYFGVLFHSEKICI